MIDWFGKHGLLSGVISDIITTLNVIGVLNDALNGKSGLTLPYFSELKVK